MLVFPFILESSSIPATLVGSQYAIYWPLALMSSYIIADILGRHIGAAFMVNLCKSKPRSETSVVFIVIIITLQLVFVAARSKLLWDFVFVPVYFSSGVTNIANSLGSTVEGCMLAAGTVGFSSGVLGTSNVLVANRVADPHEKVILENSIRFQPIACICFKFLKSCHFCLSFAEYGWRVFWCLFKYRCHYRKPVFGILLIRLLASKER